MVVRNVLVFRMIQITFKNIPFQVSNHFDDMLFTSRKDRAANMVTWIKSPAHLFTDIFNLLLQKHVADFYISDFQSGLRAMVKAGYGAKVAAFVKPTTVVNVTKDKRELSPSFLRWLADRNLSSDDRIMRLKEGYGFYCSVPSVIGDSCFFIHIINGFSLAL